MTTRDGKVRYVTLRADTLMGMFRRLPEPVRTQALSALASSTAEHGGDSARRYLESGASDAAALLAEVEQAAAELGWGTWRFGARGATRLALEVANSPFAAGHGASGDPVCAPIRGMLEAVAGIILAGACEAQELQCQACGAASCRFEANLRRRA